MKVTPRFLLIVAAIVWIIAGFNVGIIGVQAGLGTWTVPLLAGSLATFVVFLALFLFITNNNAKRIDALPSAPINVFRFMDVKAYLIMGFMIALGIIVRVFALAPISWIAFFYTGLGSALAIAGVAYFVVFCDHALNQK
jgi:hypothetical protein